MGIIILFVVVFSMLVALGFGLASAISDFKSMTIPNIYAAGVALAFIPAFAADALSGGAGGEFFFSWKSHCLAAGLVFFVTILLFGAGLIGAGDSKLCSAFALWVGIPGMASFLFYMAVAGALLGIATKIMHKKILVAEPASGGWIEKAQNGGNGVPYGIAIFFGAAVAFWQLGYVLPEKLALLAGYTETLP